MLGVATPVAQIRWAQRSAALALPALLALLALALAASF
jgi:hypothetical protein